MKKIYIKENKLSLLKEENSPDCVFIDDEVLSYFDKDAHAFIVMNGKDGFKIAIGEEGSIHSSIRNEIAANYMGFRTYDDFKEYIYENEEYYDDLYGELEMYIDDICNNSLYDGRYWINKEIITFWYKTPSTEKLDLILNEICEKLGVDVSNVRVVVGNHIILYEEYNYWDDIDNDKFKPKDSKSDKELRAIHLMNQQDKKDALKDFRQNRGEIQGKKLGKMPMAQYHSLIYQEEKNSNKELLKEYYSSPDTIYIDGKVMTYDDYNVYPFIVVDGDLFIGDEGTTHNDVGLQYVINYFNFDGFSDYIERRDAKVIQFKADIGKGINDDTIKCGRYWADENVLSIWHPEKLKEGELEFIVQELKEHFNINEMDLGFVYEGDIIPYINFVQDDDYEENEKESEMRAIHLMNQQDKRDALKDFRQNRGEIQGKKLGKMPMAQYHSLIYQENKNKKKVIKEFFYRDNQANADNVIVQDLDLHLWWEDSGAYPFGWFYQYDGDYKLFIGDESSMHSSPCEKALHKYINDKITEDESRADIDGTFNDELNGYSKYSFLEHPDDVSYREETETEDDRNDYYYEPYFDPSNYLISNYISYNHTVNEFDEMLQTMDVSGRFWKYDKVISFWSSMSPSMLAEYIDDLQSQTNIDFSDYMYVYEDYDDENSIKYCTVSEFINSGRDIEFKADERENKGIHLMKPKEKAEALKDFKSIRGEKQGQKLGNMTMAQYHNLIYQEEKDIDTILENFSLEVEPNEVDLSSFEIEKSLNKEIWGENNKLNSRIRLKLLDIADDFFNSLEVNFVKPIDIVLTGSLCNFNWSEFSDIDLHIIVNFDEISEKTEFVKEYFDAKKNEWNNEHKDLKIYDFPIELYVQNSNEYGISNGMYSLESNEWIKEPNINNLEPLDKVSSQKIKRIASNIMTKIDDYFDYFAECSDNHKLELLNNEIDNLLYKLKVYRQKGLEKYGESGTPNIVYKVLKRTKYLEDLWELRTQIYDKLNSIN